MGILGFGNKKENAIANVIRCDLDDYLVWKWTPDAGGGRRENAIRYGSRLRVKAGEIAAFVYPQGDKMIDYIRGPFDQTIKTANFPVLSKIVGLAYGGDSPFQAEVYFINLAGTIRMPFFVDWFGVSDHRYKDLRVQAQVKGSVIFSIDDYQHFIELHRMKEVDMDELSLKMRDMLVKYLKSSVTNISETFKISVLHLERVLDQVSEYVTSVANPKLVNVLGVKISDLSISEIRYDQESPQYRQLEQLGLQQAATVEFQYELERKNAADMQEIGALNVAETMRIQREEAQRRQKLGSESTYIQAHQLNIQGQVGMAAAESLGQMNANMGFGSGEGGGMNPAGMMTGMMMGGAIGGNMANMMGGMMQGMNQPQPPAPPVGQIIEFHLYVNGQQCGPYGLAQLRQMVQTGQLQRDTYVWKAGMASWAPAGSVPELSGLFGAVPPPVPPVPPPPPQL